MSPRNKVSTTKKDILQVAVRMFLEKGFTDTSVKSISDSLGISTGNLTFHYPTKEHLLALLVEMLCDFQWRVMEVTLDEGASALQAVCLELTTMAAICEDNAIARDFYLAAYRHPMSLDIIRRSDTQKAKWVYGPYCQGWQEQDYMLTEELVSGIEYATLMTTACSVPLADRIDGALNAVLRLYAVPEELRRENIRKVMSMDYRSIGRQVLEDFISYVHHISEEQLETFLSRR